jgi:hypothetical protein
LTSPRVVREACLGMQRGAHHPLVVAEPDNGLSGPIRDRHWVWDPLVSARSHALEHEAIASGRRRSDAPPRASVEWARSRSGLDCCREAWLWLRRVVVRWRGRRSIGRLRRARRLRECCTRRCAPARPGGLPSVRDLVVSHRRSRRWPPTSRSLAGPQSPPLHGTLLGRRPPSSVRQPS